MTRHYHITPEQADALALKVSPECKYVSAYELYPETLTAIINAALDEILGEPVAYQTPLRYGSKVTHNKPVKPDDWDDDELTEWFCISLYAPRR